MKESKKEKTIRYLLILVICILLFAAFSYRNKNLLTHTSKMETDFPLAVVLKKGTSYENPLVALYEKEDDERFLAIYEIQKNNHYFFHTLKAVKLHDPLEDISTDRSSLGIWIKISGKWHYLNESLHEKDRSLKNKSSDGKIKYSIKTFNDKKQLFLPNGKIALLDGKEKVKEIYPLTETNDLWLVITENDVKVVEAFE